MLVSTLRSRIPKKRRRIFSKPTGEGYVPVE